MHWHNAQVGCKKHPHYISWLMSKFNFVLREMNNLLQQHAAKCPFQISEVGIGKSEI
jgi:hypothetical protein